MTAVAIDALTKTFGKRVVLNRVSFAIQPGEMVALIGASGSGKSTLIRHLAGLVDGDRTSGEIRVGDHLIQSHGRISPDIRAQRVHIGVIFQQFNLVGRLSVLTNVLVGLLGHIPPWRGTLGWFSRAEKQQALAALDRVGMADFAGQRAATLSGGQQQRVAIARTLVQQAQLILADEPIASLDPEAARRVMDILSRINREDGTTVVVSLHQVDYALAHCGRAIALVDGALAFDGACRDITGDLLKDIYHTEAATLGINTAQALNDPSHPTIVPNPP